MDSVLADTLTANLKSASTPEAKAEAQTLALIALVDCQHKTSDRVKKLIAEKEAENNRRVGAKIALGAVIGIMSVVGPAVAIKICKVIGVMW